MEKNTDFEFDEVLLSNTDPVEWLEARYEALEDLAGAIRTEADAGKVLALTVTAWGVALGAFMLNPIGWVGAIAGGLGYGVATVQDKCRTGKFHLLPFYRGRLDQALGDLGDKDRRDERRAYQRYRKQISDLDIDAEESDLALLSYLPKLQQAEAEMLIRAEELVAYLLAQLPEEKREVGYKYLVRASRRHGKRLAKKVTVEALKAYINKEQSPLHAYRQTQQLIDAGVQQSHSIGATNRLDAIETEAVYIDAEAAVESPEDMLKRLVHMPLFMIVSPQGCGKSTTLQWLATYAAQLGWRVVVADPHYEFGTYPNLPVFGKAKKYAECGELIETILDIVNQRYEERSTKPKEQRNLVPYLFILDEFTSWSRYCKESSEKLIASSLEDFRKAEVHLVFASHGLTKKQTGGADGYYQTLIDSAAVLKLKGKQVATKEGPKLKPLGKAELTEMGESKGIVDMPNLTDWKMPEDLPACDFRLNGEATKDSRDKQTTSEDVTPQFEASPWGEVKPTRWSVTQELAADKMPGIATVMTWIDNRNGSPFTLEQARTNNKLRSLIENIDAPGKDVSQKIRSAIKSLVRSDLLKENAEGKLQLTQKAKSRWEG